MVSRKLIATLLSISFLGLVGVVLALREETRCYVSAAPLRVKVGDTLFLVPQYMKPSIHSNSKRDLPKFSLINKDSGGYQGEGYCQSAADAPLEADAIDLDVKMANRLPAGISLFRDQYPRMDLPTYCDEQSKLAEYKPCADMADFLCRDVKPQASLGPNRYLYNPSFTIAGMPPILACANNLRGAGQFCRVLIAVAHDARVRFYPRKPLKIGVNGGLASDDGRKLIARLTELKNVVQTIMPNIDAANAASICTKN